MCTGAHDTAAMARTARVAASQSRSLQEARSRSVLLIGATSGIMKALAHELAAKRFDLLLIARDRQEVETLASDLHVRYEVDARAFVLDALSFDEHEGVLDACFQEAAGTLAGVILGLGYLGEQARAEREPGEARRIIETNLTAPALLLASVASRMEKTGTGFVCALSSVAGDRGRQSNYIYGSAKAGLSTFLQGLRNRMHHSGVQVTTIKPGFVDTAMTYGMRGLFLVASPEKVARGIIKAIELGKDEVYVPGFWRSIMIVIRAVPEPIFKRLRL